MEAEANRAADQIVKDFDAQTQSPKGARSKKNKNSSSKMNFFQSTSSSAKSKTFKKGRKKNNCKKASPLGNEKPDKSSMEGMSRSGQAIDKDCSLKQTSTPGGKKKGGAQLSENKGSYDSTPGFESDQSSQGFSNLSNNDANTDDTVEPQSRVDGAEATTSSLGPRNLVYSSSDIQTTPRKETSSSSHISKPLVTHSSEQQPSVRPKVQVTTEESPDEKIESMLGQVIEFDYEVLIDLSADEKFITEQEPEVTRVKQSGYEDIKIFQKLDELAIDSDSDETQVLKEISERLKTVFEELKDVLERRTV